MKPRELEIILMQLDMTQEAFAGLMDCSSRAVRRWITGVYPIPRPVALLARLLVAGKITRRNIEKETL